MFIDVRIPWEPNRKLGYAFNRMMESVSGWVLILDWDVLLLNINWYDMCVNAINEVGDKAGLISCVTNRIGSPLQKATDQGGYMVNCDCDDIGYHMNMSEQIALNNKGIITDVTDEKRKLSGMFFLTNKEIYNKIGPVPDKFIGLDTWYHDRVKEAGYKIYIMKDLYVFHNYRRQWK